MLLIRRLRRLKPGKTMPRSDEQLQEQLLAYHLGGLSRAEMDRLDRLIESSPEIAARSRELQLALAPLADWQALPACEDLERHILRRTEAADPAWSLDGAVQLDPLPLPAAAPISRSDTPSRPRSASSRSAVSTSCSFAEGATTGICP